MGSTRTNVTSLKHHIILLILSKKSLQDNLTKDFYAYIIDGWLILIGDYYPSKRSHLSLKYNKCFFAIDKADEETFKEATTNNEAKNTTKHQHLIFFNDIQLV